MRASVCMYMTRLFKHIHVWCVHILECARCCIYVFMYNYVHVIMSLYNGILSWAYICMCTDIYVYYYLIIFDLNTDHQVYINVHSIQSIHPKLTLFYLGEIEQS